MSDVPVLQLLRSFAELVDARAALPISSHRAFPVGAALVRVKRAYRKLFQPFINETLRGQAILNERALALFQRLFLDLRSIESANLAFRGEFETRLRALEEELSRLKATGASTGSDVSKPPAPGGKRSSSGSR